MSKKRLSKEQKIRRQQELLKAQNKTLRGYSSDNKIQADTNLNEDILKPKSEKKDIKFIDSYSLPVSQIKSDLVKIILFAVFSVVFLIFLKVGNIDINAVRGFINL